MADGDRIRNPATGRMVKRSGKIGQAILAAREDARVAKKYAYSLYIDGLRGEVKAYALSLGKIPLRELEAKIQIFKRDMDEAEKAAARKDMRNFVESIKDESERRDINWFIALHQPDLPAIKAKLAEIRREAKDRLSEEERRREEEQSRMAAARLREQMDEAKRLKDLAIHLADPRWDPDAEHDTDNFYGQ